MTYTAVHIAEFPAAAAARKNGTAKRSIVVLDGVAPQDRVFSFTPHISGLTHGMSRVRAETVIAAECLRRNVTEEESAFEELCERLNAFSPRIQSFSSPLNQYCSAVKPCVAMLLDSSGMSSLFGNNTKYVDRLHNEIGSAGFDSSVVLATNAESALMLARGASGTLVVKPCDLLRMLAGLPISLLPTDERLLGTLARWGIRTLGQLAQLPDAALTSRLGQSARRLQLLARGEAEHMFVPDEAALELHEAQEFDSPVELLESLLFVMSPLLEAVMRKATERAYALRSVALSLGLDGGGTHTVRVQPASPTQNREVLLKLLHLEMQANSPHAPIVSVALRGEVSQPSRAQRGLFQSQFPEADRLDLLLARLRSIAGNGNVGSPVLANTHREDEFVLSEFRPSPRQRPEGRPQAQGLTLRIFRPQQAVRVAIAESVPKLIFWHGRRRSVTACAGPWHSSGSWWDGRAWDHDLWDVVMSEPVQTLRLRHEHGRGAWSAVGIYD